MIGYRNYKPSEVGIGTAIVDVLKDYRNQKLDENFVAHRIGRFRNETEFYFENLREVGIVERKNGYIWLKRVAILKNINLASA